MSAANSGGVLDNVSITASSILKIDLSKAFAISLKETCTCFGLPLNKSRP